MALESKASGWRGVVVEVEMEVGGGSGVVVARVSCWWCPAGSFVDAASPGKFPRPQALEPIGSSPCSRLPLRAVHMACMFTEENN